MSAYCEHAPHGWRGPDTALQNKSVHFPQLSAQETLCRALLVYIQIMCATDLINKVLFLKQSGHKYASIIIWSNVGEGVKQNFS